jgi:hypothetical protein
LILTISKPKKFIKNPYVFYENSSEVESNSSCWMINCTNKSISYNIKNLPLNPLNDELLKEYSKPNRSN